MSYSLASQIDILYLPDLGTSVTNPVDWASSQLRSFLILKPGPIQQVEAQDADLNI